MSPEEYEAVPSYDDVPSIPAASGGEGWHPDLPRVKWDALLGVAILIEEFDLRDSTFNVSEDPNVEKKKYALVRFRTIDKAVPGTFEDGAVVVTINEEATTGIGGVRVIDQLKKVQRFPTKGRVGREKTRGGRPIWQLDAL